METVLQGAWLNIQRYASICQRTVRLSDSRVQKVNAGKMPALPRSGRTPMIEFDLGDACCNGLVELADLFQLFGSFLNDANPLFHSGGWIYVFGIIVEKIHHV